MYVEDDIHISEELLEILQNDVKNIYFGKDGQEGLELYKKYAPDIIITDICMPIMNGLDMSQAILNINPSAPIIVASAFNDVEYLMKAIKLGVHHYLAKPIILKELLTSLISISKNIIIEKELVKSRKILEQYKFAVDKNEVITKSDINGVITYVNEAFCKLSGYTEKELIGKRHSIVRHKDTPVEFIKDLWDTILSKKEWHGIMKNCAKDGSTYIVSSTIIPVLDENDEIEEFISLRKDVTQEEKNKQKIQSDLEVTKKTVVEKEKFINEYENALQNHTLFCRTNRDGVISTASKSFRKLLGISSNSDGYSYFDFVDESEDKAQLKKYIKDSIEHSMPWNGVLKHRNSKGDLLYLNSSFIPIIDINGEIEEILCFYTDTTDEINLNHEIINTQREIIYRMGAIGESRSKETGEHVKRVAEYSKLLALKHGLSVEEAEEIKMASPMHDIGKVGIPDSILNKPGKLSHDEFEIMKTHSELGFEMLSGSNQPLLNTASIISLTHHEKWDGSGYPKGLKGEDIHIYGRITAIADVFDALGHDRIYKKAWPLEDILALLKEGSGKHFDPNLVNLFFNNLDTFLATQKMFSNSSGSK